MLQVVPAVSAQRAVEVAAAFPRPLALHTMIHRGHPHHAERNRELLQKETEELIRKETNVNKTIANKLFRVFVSLDPQEDIS